MDTVSKTEPLVPANAFAFGVSFNEQPDYRCLSQAFCTGSSAASEAHWESLCQPHLNIPEGLPIGALLLLLILEGGWV